MITTREIFQPDRLSLLRRHAVIILLLLLLVSGVAGAAVHSNSMVVPIIQDSPETLFKKARKFQETQRLDSALIYYSWLTESHRDTKDRATRELVGEGLSQMGQIYYIYYDNYMSAYRCLAEAESILGKSTNREAYAAVLLNLGNLFNIYEYIFPQPTEKGQGRGRNYYELSFQEGQSSGNWNIVCSAYINSVMLDLPFKVNRSLNLRMKKLLTDSIPKTVPDYQLTRYLCDGLESISSGRHAKAREIFRAMRDSLGIEAPRDRFMADLCLSAVAVNEKDFQGAINSISRIFDEPSDRNLDDVYMEVYDLLSKYYAEIGRRDMADAYRIKFYEAKDNITKHIVELEPTRISLELDQVRDHARQLDAEKKRTVIIVIALVFVILLTVAIAVVIYRKNRQLTLKNKVIFNQIRPMFAESSPAPDSGEAKTEKYRDSSLGDEKRRDLIVKIDKVMADVDEICAKGFSMQRLTDLVGSNTSYISQIINDHYKMTFSNLLNKHRIQEACRRMEDTERYGHLTIDAISESVGFNTRSTFTKAFRLNIGMLPSEYLKMLRTPR